MKLSALLVSDAGKVRVSELSPVGGGFSLACGPEGAIMAGLSDFRLETHGSAIRFRVRLKYTDGRLSGSADDVELVL